MTTTAWDSITQIVHDLDRPIDRTYAWAAAAHDLAAAEIGQTPPGEQSDAIWAYGSMQTVKASLVAAGAQPTYVYTGQLDRHTARTLLIDSLRELIKATDSLPTPSADEFAALGDALDFAVDSYVALTGHLPS